MSVDYFKIYSYFYISYLIKYIVSCSFFYFIFWKRQSRFTAAHRIQNIDFLPEDIRRDFLTSLKCFLFASLFMTLFAALKKKAMFGYIIYSNYSLNSFFVNIPLTELLLWIFLLMWIHETTSYWLHRLFHTPFFFKHIHSVHHTSRNPNPFTSGYFHPLEVVLGSVWVVLTIAILNPPPSAWLYFSIMHAFVNAFGHSGIEFFPKSWSSHFLLKYLNSSTNHNDHHKTVNINFGYYFNVWDRLMGTGKYEEK